MNLRWEEIFVARLVFLHSQINMADQNLEILESRLKSLENSVYGDSNKDLSYPKVIDSLSNIDKQLNTAVASRDKIKKLLDQTPLMEKYLDPTYASESGLSQTAKVDIILSEEDQIRKLAADFEKIKNATQSLDSEHLKGIPKVASRLQQLAQVNIDQKEQVGQLTEDVRNLLVEYNNTISLLSKQFIQWDEIVTQLEIDAQPKKSYD
ncbi:unnamed protein product [Owenia fusiformis]|uniref:Uncharacterized protein n=1 Tax=Owenia fusiformis TaxID=6347 RepID=A0A8J1TX42_OWEFU|nr:unnamed protein product [Owenia fusiformis]